MSKNNTNLINEEAIIKISLAMASTSVTSTNDDRTILVASQYSPAPSQQNIPGLDCLFGFHNTSTIRAEMAEERARLAEYQARVLNEELIRTKELLEEQRINYERKLLKIQNKLKKEKEQCEILKKLYKCLMDQHNFCLKYHNIEEDTDSD